MKSIKYQVSSIKEYSNLIIFKLGNSLKIENWELKIPHFSERGFTIVEVLVVAAILGVIGYMMSDIVVRSLQGSQKTAVIGTSKQNGQVVLDSVAQVIRNSDVVVCIGSTLPVQTGQTSGDNVVLYSQDGRYVRFRLDTVGSNSTIVEDFPDVNVLINNNPSDPNFPKSMQANVCETAVYPELGRKVLTDTDNSSGVLIQKVGGTTNIFTVTKSPGSNDMVTIQFDVKPSGAGGGFENQLGGPGFIQFQETVQLR